jgi:hypothetical protein
LVDEQFYFEDAEDARWNADSELPTIHELPVEPRTRR